MARLARSQFTALHDTVMAGASFVAALYLRLGDAVFWQTEAYLWEGTFAFAAIAAVVFLRTGVYRGVWRYASLPDLYALARASTWTVLIFLPVIFLVFRAEGFPRSAIVINWFTLMAFTGAPRLIYRVVKDGSLAHVLERGGASPNVVPVVLLGADDEAEQFARAMARTPEAPYVVTAMIDPTGRRAGQYIRGLDVLDGSAGLDAPLERAGRRGPRPQRLLLTSGSARPAWVADALKACERHGLTLARVGRVTDFAEGGTDNAPVRPVAIEDLLGRPQTAVDRDSIARLVGGRRILVTGAGGTIGGELCRQIAALGPAHLTLLELSEVALYEIDLEIRRDFPALPCRALLRDVRDRMRLDRALAQERPDIVFHAAALKHVPLAEANPNETILTNVAGTVNVADACRGAGVATMVLISTDKAVNPSSVMGATKRVAELYVQSLGRSGNGTRFATVRFGNVLGSTGSVVPLFQRQLAAGGPLTVTHPDMTRFMMTVREAVELVLQASALDGASGDLFVLDMGEPLRIQGLARQMIRLAGMVPDQDVGIVFTGMRPGEKIHEELVYDDETLERTAREGVNVAVSRPALYDDLRQRLDRLIAQATAGDGSESVAQLALIVPEFRRIAPE